MRYAIQKSRKGGYKGGYAPLFEKNPHPKPEIRYYDADSVEDAKWINFKEHGFDWQYTVIKPVFEIGDYIGDYDDVCYLVKAITEETITIFNLIRNTESTEYVDYERWHLLRKNNHEDVINYPIGSQWKCLKESGLCENQDIVTITDYALSKGVFWVSCERNKFCKFIATSNDLVGEI